MGTEVAKKAVKMVRGDTEDGYRRWERKPRQKKEMRSEEVQKMIGKRWIGERTNAI